MRISKYENLYVMTGASHALAREKSFEIGQKVLGSNIRLNEFKDIFEMGRSSCH